jgi:hypothetical protein
VCVQNQFPEVVGTFYFKGYALFHAPRRVLRHVDFQDNSGDKLKVFLNLYPGGVDKYVERLNTVNKNLKTTPGEWVVFLGLMLLQDSALR